METEPPSAAVVATCLLSICIPTFNRAAKVEALVERFLSVDGEFQLCVHDDGSSDDSYKRLLAVARTDPRLLVTTASNQGRAGALKEAVRSATGKYIMFFDDDDDVFPEAFKEVLVDCSLALKDGVGGYIYQMRLPDGGDPDPFPVRRSNLVELRADYHVRGDKKEVVLASVLRPLVLGQPHARRVPTSLLWVKIAQKYDVICRNVAVGEKYYQPTGMSANIGSLKIKNAKPMLALSHAKVRAFFYGRYRSKAYLFSALIATVWYGFLSMVAKE